jgi:hypothetical protein
MTASGLCPAIVQINRHHRRECADVNYLGIGDGARFALDQPADFFVVMRNRLRGEGARERCEECEGCEAV